MDELLNWLPVVSLALSVGTFFIGRMSASRASGKDDGIMLTEIGYIKRAVDDLTDKVDKNSNLWHDLDRRVSVLERTMKLYHGNGNNQNGGNVQC